VSAETASWGVGGGRIHRDPFSWAVLDGFIPSAVADRLAADFPQDGFRAAGTNVKLFRVRSLVVDGVVPSAVTALSCDWGDFARYLTSPDYRERLEQVVSTDLGGLRIDATFCRYRPGSSLAPHTDQPKRVATHVLYFNAEWQPGWGGGFRILRSDDVDDVIEEVLPTLHTSVAMVRSDCSWHAVASVADGVTHERLSVLVHASRPE
jgi:hypothetical protein